MSNYSDSKSASEYDSESDSDEDNDDEVLAVIDNSSDQDSTVESDEADDARESSGQWSNLSCLDQEEELGPGWIVFKTAM